MPSPSYVFRVFNVATQEYDPQLVPNANIDANGHFHFNEDPTQYIIEQWTGEYGANGEKIFKQLNYAQNTPAS